MFLNGLLGSILLGIVVSTFFTGSMFSMNKLNILNLSAEKMPVISSWETPYHGLEAIWTLENMAFIQNLALGIAVFFLARTLGLLYFSWKNIKKGKNRHIWPFSVFFCGLHLE